jgi:hypothetical protein
MTNEFLTFDDDNAKNWLKTILHEGEVWVTFRKKDGTERKMHCTLAENRIPAEKLPKGTGKAKNSDALAVFDVENQAWRSFRFDSVMKLNFKV